MLYNYWEGNPPNMATRKVKFAEGEYYHIYNRGVDKRKIFLDERDCERFLTLLFLSNSKIRFEISKNPNEDWSFEKCSVIDRGEKIISIGAFCLMPNHFHILVKEEVEGGVTRFMTKLQTGYAMYFNKKCHRTGSLFEGMFKSEHVDSDVYLKYLYAYIHLNPIGIIDKGWKEKKITDIKKVKDFLFSYDYSSLKDFLGGEPSQERLYTTILNKDAFPKYFETSAKFKDMLKEWMNFEDKELLMIKK